MEEKKTINLKEKAKEAWAWAKKKSKETFYATKDFWEENKEFLVVLAPVGAAIAGFIVKSANNSSKDREERDRKDLYVWDARSGRWWRIRRPMTVSEQLEFERRKAEGEMAGDILASMRLL